jgi:predicted dehydrogenase
MGVIGLGAMGGHHVRVLSEEPSVNLVAVADVDDDSRNQVERARRVVAYADYEEMLQRENLEAVVIALPTSLHEQAATVAAEAGVGFLVEKPIAGSVEAGRRIRDVAEKAGVPAVVGHIERFNPVVTAAKRGIVAGELGRIFQIRANRTGPLPVRIKDVGVVVDLATHDFDMVRFLIDQPVERVFAETAKRMLSDHEDLFSGLMRFSDGAIALFDVNWLTPIKIRELRIVGEGGLYRVDLLNQDLYFYENSHTRYWSDSYGRVGVSEGNMVKYRIDRGEPLRFELLNFVQYVRGTKAQIVSLDDGIAAVQLGEAVMLSAELHRAVWRDELIEPSDASAVRVTLPR